MANLSTYTHKSYDGGLNNTVNQRDIKRNEASLLRNWDITYSGQLTRREGVTQSGDTQSSAISGLHAYIQADSTGTQDILLTEGTNLKYLNGASFSTLDSGFTAGNDFTFATVPHNDKVYLCNEDNFQHSWDRASTTLNSCLTDLGTTVPHGNVIKWHKNHMFVANNVTISGTTYPNRLYWSALGDPDTYDTTNDFIEMPGGGRIITLAELGNSLVIFKERSIMFMSGWGDTDWRVTASSSNVTNIDEAVGCVAPKGVTRVGNEIWFMDEDAQIRRIYQTDFDPFRRDIISTKIRGTLSGINKTRLYQTTAWTHDDKVYFSVPNASSTSNNLLLVFDVLASKRTGEEAWTTYTGWTADFFMSYPTSTTPDLYFADGTNKKVFLVGGNDDAGTAINARWDGKEDDFDEPVRYKRFVFGEITGESTSDIDIAVYAQVDNAVAADLGDLNLSLTGGTLGPTGTFELGPTGTTAILAGAGTGEFRFTYDTGGGAVEGKTLRHSIRHNVADEKPTVNTFTSHYKLRRLK